MFQALFNIIFNLLATIVQIVMLPINLIVDNALPDLADTINYITSSFPSLFANLSWFVNILPTFTRNILLLAINILIAKYTIYLGSRLVIKVWNLFQKLKFW